jgi:hypothetical protein
MSTLTAYSQTGHGGANVACDGWIGRTPYGEESWATIRDNADGNERDSDGYYLYSRLQAGTTTDKWQYLRRSFVSLDTSGIGAGQTVTAATFKFRVESASNAFASAPSFHLVAATPATANDLADADFDQRGSTSFGSVAWADVKTDGSYTAITLNAAGLAAIAMQGVTKFALLTSWDFDNTSPTWGSGLGMTVYAYGTDQGTSYRPYLEVTYSASGAEPDRSSLVLLRIYP